MPNKKQEEWKERWEKHVLRTKYGRKIKGNMVSRMNKEISDLCGEPSIVIMIRQRQFRWLDNEERLPIERVPKSHMERLPWISRKKQGKEKGIKLCQRGKEWRNVKPILFCVLFMSYYWEFKNL